MSHHNIVHHHSIKYLLHKEVDDLYISVFLKLMGESFISIFTAIFLLTLGFSLADVARYYLIFFLTVSIFMTLGMKLNAYLGVKKTLALGTIIYIIYYFLLPQINSGLPYGLVAFIYGLAAAFYFAGLNVEIGKTLEMNREAKELSMLKILAFLVGIVGPFIGAIIIVKFSFTYLFFLASFLLILSIIPLFLTKDYKLDKFNLSLPQLKNSDTKRKAIAYQVLGVLSVAVDILWPVFLFLNYKNIISLGGIVSITSLLVVVMIYFAGKLIDKDNVMALKVGTLSHSPTWLVRLIFITPTGLLFSNLLNTMTYSIIGMSLDKSFYKKSATSPNVPLYMLYREYNLGIGRTAILLCALFIPNLTILFIIVGVLTLFFLLIVPELKMQQS